jgi:23S rRNA pseudouridine2605 synthase
VTTQQWLWYGAAARLRAPEVRMRTNKAGKSGGVGADGERLQRFLARCGIASRRAAEELITSGRVEVNGEVVTELGTKVIAGRDDVRFDGERVKLPADRYVLLLHKPVGVLCSRDDPERRPLVYGLLPPEPSLRSIGRRDFHTIYEARVRGLPTPDTLARLVRGVILDDGPARVTSIEVIKTTDKNAWVRVTLQEGRNREVRRILERVGHPVMRLRRVRFAGLGLDGLKQGQWRQLEDKEISDLESRGHVGPFGLPPDPRRRGVRAAGVAEAAASSRPKEKPPRRDEDKPARARTPAAARGRKVAAPPPPPREVKRRGGTRAGASAGKGPARPSRSAPSGRGKR